MSRFIKVHFTFPEQPEDDLAGETMWALPIGPTTAKLNSIPFFAPFGKGDLVEHRDGEITRILESCTHSAWLQYCGEHAGEDNPGASFSLLAKHLSEYDILVEGMVVGLCVASVPRDVDEEQLERILQAAPIEVSHKFFHLAKSSDEFKEIE